MSTVKPERRSRRRHPARVPVTIKAQSGDVQATGVTRDLDSSGIFIYTDSKISEGSELEMVLILPPEITHGECDPSDRPAVLARLITFTAAGLRADAWSGEGI